MIRPGWSFSLAALALGGATAWFATSNATEAARFALQLSIAAMVMLAIGLVVGSRLVVGASTAAMLGVVILEATLNDDASWVSALAIGCLWFVTVEIGFEALDRRDGVRRTAAATAQRVQEVTVVVASALGLGLVAIAATPLAPIRSVLVQAVVLGLVLGVFVAMLRRVAAASPAARE